MALIRATASADIGAPPRIVYDLIADYRAGHPRILPPRYFADLRVLHGGRGAGTVIQFRMPSVAGKRLFRAEITEPEPGRRLVETEIATGTVTTFDVAPAADGSSCRVTISTEWTVPGIRGWLERRFGPPLLRRIYRQELELLAKVARDG